jgi:hypothetical protein
MFSVLAELEPSVFFPTVVAPIAAFITAAAIIFVLRKMGGTH